MNAIIICGGLSTRLGEITKSVPKILLEIKGKSVLEWQLEKIKKLGITSVVLAAGHLAEVLHAKVGLKFAGVDLIYAIEDKRLGTGGAVKHAIEYLDNPNDTLLILNGDILTTVDFVDMKSFLRPTSDGIMLGSEVEDAGTYETLEIDEKYHLKLFKKRTGAHEKGLINGGVYMFNAVAQKYFPETEAFSMEADVFPKMTGLYVYASNRPWIDIGVPERLEWARNNWVI